MKVLVIFDFPEIKDVNGPDADLALSALSDDLRVFANHTLYKWHIEDAFGDDDDGTEVSSDSDSR